MSRTSANANPRWAISTDLDGTLLDHTTYSWAAAKEALERCDALGVPVVLNTSKTWAEVKTLHQQLKLTAPVVVENGSALLIPQNTDPTLHLFGQPRAAILDFIQTIRAEKAWHFTGFSDWSLAELQAQTGLDVDSAREAMQKEYSEPFLWQDTDANLATFIKLAEAADLSVLKGGRFYHLQGRTTKAIPLQWLRDHPSQWWEIQNKGAPQPDQPIHWICLGDNHNDIAMLEFADIPVCVKSPENDYPAITTDKDVIYTAGEGPHGWCEAVNPILDRLITKRTNL